jgi:hypothetical protein
MLFRCTRNPLRRCIVAGRAVQPIVVPDSSPWRKSDADCRLGVMNPAINPAVLSPLEERARMPLFPIGLNPVVDPVNEGQVTMGKARGCAAVSVRKADKDMGEDVLPASGNPRNQVFGDPFLVPSPLLAAFTALPAVLRHRNGISGD